MVLTTRASLFAAATTLLLATPATLALDQKLSGINYDLRQGADWETNNCKSSNTIASDLKVLATITDNVRTYSLSDCDVAPVLTAAKDLGLTVWLGVWVSEDESVYNAELEALNTLLSADLIDDNVVGFNVGSEAVYRGDITAEQAIKYVTDFKAVLTKKNISTPVSITDIVDILLQYPDMITAGDVITVNQFPFWEKIDASDAAQQFKTRIDPLVELAGGKEIIISETGWPTGGTAENGSVANEANGAQYLNDFYSLAKQEGWRYYYFAGFDTPYKETQSQDPETVEAHFGIFDEDGKMKEAYSSLTFKDVTFSDGSSTSTSSTAGTTTTSSGTSAGTVHAGGDDSTTSTTSSSTAGDSTTTGSESGNTESSDALQLTALGLTACFTAVSALLML